jgi:hypothetical protein
MRYRLRTLLILLAILPPLLAVGWSKYAAWKAEQERKERIDRLARQSRPAVRVKIRTKHGDWTRTVTVDDDLSRLLLDKRKRAKPSEPQPDASRR